MIALLPIIFVLQTVQLLGGIILTRDTAFPNISFVRSGPVLTSKTDCPFSVTCGSGTGFKIGGSQLPQVASSQNCESILTAGRGFTQLSKYQEAYQKFREYIESCFNEYHAWLAFSEMTDANTHRIPDTLGKNLEYRDWLKQVLYYNTSDPLYYCEDLRAIYSSYLGFDRADGADMNAARAIARYILDSTNCDHMKESLSTQIKNQITAYLEIWRDTVTDSVATPFDTTTPTIDELGLSIIRKGQNYVLPDYILVEAIHNITAIPNPVGDQLTIEYELKENCISNIEIHDLLGREISRTDRNFELKGKQSRQFNTASWEAGTYFVRITTSQGEVKTIKVFKE